MYSIYITKLMEWKRKLNSGTGNAKENITVNYKCDCNVFEFYVELCWKVVYPLSINYEHFGILHILYKV